MGSIQEPMSNLGDYIGQILSEITIARVQADMQAVRLADMYATHPLLKTFPVPRFRLPKVTIDVPVAVSEVRGAPKSRAARTGLDMTKARKAFDTALKQQLTRSGLKLAGDAKRKLLVAVEERFEQLTYAEDVSTSAVHVADSVTKVVQESLSRGKLDTKAQDRFVSELRQIARLALVKLLPTPPRVRVVTNTAQLRELSPIEFLTRLQFDVSEQGMEWRGEDGDGKRLVPE
jgi:hypothetical protein